ncbi:DGQHR domain-containing protein [Pectobacterium versatile]|nr:DGQHR domain-containing protein [Pectobacterium versatile]
MKDYYEFLAFKVSQPFADYYACVIPSEILKNISFSLKAENVDGIVQGVQRLINNKRLQEISKFIDGESAAFPNSIILGANFLKTGRYAEEDDRCIVESMGDNIYTIKIPKHSEVLSIIDGQHRLYAFDHAETQMDLLCAIYIDLAMPYQAFLFSTINYNQGKVDKSLAYQLFGYELDNEEPINWPPETLAVYLVRILNNEQPLLNRIKYRTADEVNRKNNMASWRISTASIVESILSLISKNPKDDRYLMNAKRYTGESAIYGRSILKDDTDYPLRKLYIQGNDKAIQEVLSLALQATDEIFWKDLSDDNFLKKTVGVACIFKFLKIVLLKHGVSRSVINNYFTKYINKIKEEEDFSDSTLYPSSTKGMNEAYKRMLSLTNF